MERCGALIHLVDITSENPMESYQIIRKELEKYSPQLAQKPEVVALNKCDCLEPNEAKKIQQKLSKKINLPVFLISGVAHQGLQELMRAVCPSLPEKSSRT